MSLSELSIRRPILAWMMMAAILIFGAAAYSRMSVGNLPDVDFPIVNVGLKLPGAVPEVMEAQVASPVEEAVGKIQGIKHLSSTSTLGSANVTIEFSLDKNIDAAVNEVQTAIAGVRQQLPKDLESPNVSKVNPEAFPILFLMVTSDKLPLPRLMDLVRERIRPEFLKLPGVGDIYLLGYVDPVRRVKVSGDRLRKYSLGVTDVVNAVANEHAELPAGLIRSPSAERNLRLVGEASTIEEMGRLAIQRRGALANYRPLPLADVAEIEEGTEDVWMRIRASKIPAIAVGITKQPGQNSVALAARVRERVAKLAGELPPGVSAKLTVDGTKFIRESVSELTLTLLLSALLTAIVCWIFLGSWQATLNVIFALPVSVLGTFLVISYLGFSLNTFTLLGLSLAVGIIVDDAIMVLENIMRHRERGSDGPTAALEGTREITFAAIASTCAVAAIFLPIAFLKGIMGKYLYQFGITLTAAVFLSLLEALTLAPMRCAQFLEKPRARLLERWLSACERGYVRTLEWSLDHRAVVVLGSFALFGLSCLLVMKLPKELVPAQDQSFFSIALRLPVGSPLDLTETKAKEIERFLDAQPEVKNYETFIGGFPGGEPNQGAVYVTLKPRDARHASQRELMDRYRDGLKGLQGAGIFFQDMSQAGFAGTGKGFPIELNIQGPKEDVIADVATKLKLALEKSGKVVDLNSDYQPGLPEVRIVPDRAKAVAHGVSVTDISQTVSALVGGIEAGKYSRDGRRWKIRVQAEAREKNDLKAILRFGVRNNRGELVPLSEVVTVTDHPSVQTITRRNRERAIGLFANLAPGHSQSEALEWATAKAKELLPDGYFLSLSGNAEAMNESFGSLVLAIVLGVVISYMILGVQFDSLVDPLTILLALPFSLTGALAALLLGGCSLNLYSLIGLVLLMGIVKKNSILLVDFANELRRDGAEARAALLRAGETRLRPILMTSLATIAGAIPAALALGPGAETRVPMGLAVVGGVLVSTLFTLVVVPCVYSMFTPLKDRGLAIIPKWRSPLKSAVFPSPRTTESPGGFPTYPPG